MKYLYSLSGATVPVIKEFDAYDNLKIEKGDIVFLDVGKRVVNVNVGEIVGVSEETHTGKEDILNERSNKTKLRVNVTMGGVYAIPPLHIAAIEDGTTTSFVCSAEKINSNIENYKLVLVEKAEGSENTDNIGDVRDVYFGSSENEKLNMVLYEGGKPCKGDVYAVYPAAGLEGYYDEKSGSFVDESNSGIGLVTVGRDVSKGYVEVKLKNTVFDK